MATVAPTVGTLHRSLRQAGGAVKQPSLRRTSEVSVQFTFTHRAIRSLWVLILLVQLLNSMQLMIFSYIYLSYAPSRGSLLGFLATGFLSSSQQAFLDTHSVFVGIVYALIGGVFVFYTLVMLLASLWHRCLRFTSRDHMPRTHRITRQSQSEPKGPIAELAHKALSSSGLEAMWSAVSLVHDRAVAWWASYGVRGEHFEQKILVREAIELFLQAAQADKVSQSVSRKFINYAYTALIATNTFVNPLLFRLYADNPPMRRFAVVFADFFLDLIWGCLLPAWMYIPYMRMDRGNVASLLSDYSYGAADNTQREVEQIVILSWSALVLSLFPFVSAILSLRSVKRLLITAKRVHSWDDLTQEQRTMTTAQISPASARHSSPERLALAESDRRRPSVTTVALPVNSTPLVVFCHRLLSICAVIFTLVAIASSGVFLRTTTSRFRVWDGDCKFPLTPWFATQRACAAWLVDCRKMGITGKASELDRAFALIHARSLVYLQLQRCIHLELPASITQLTSLRSLSIYKSHLESWATESSITQNHFPELRTLALENTTITDEPRRVKALMAGAWPPHVENVIFVSTDITQLPASDRTLAWTNIKRWSCVDCKLSEFPSTLFRSANIMELTIENSTVKSIPSATEWLQENTPPGTVLWPQLTHLRLRNNRELRVLSDEVWELMITGSLLELCVESTSIASIPAGWIDAVADTSVVFANGTPLCAQAKAPAIVCEEIS